MASELMGSLTVPEKLQNFRDSTLGILQARLFCLYHFSKQGLIPELVIYSGCSELKAKKLNGILNGIKKIPARFPSDYMVYCSEEVSLLGSSGWERFIKSVYEAFWTHYLPGNYLIGCLNTDDGVGVLVAVRAQKSGCFSKRDKAMALGLCPHLDNFLRLRPLCFLRKDWDWANWYFRNRGLSKRELELVNHILKGSQAKEIAEAMGICVNTVCDHTKSVYRKLGVHSRAELCGVFFRTFIQAFGEPSPE